MTTFTPDSYLRAEAALNQITADVSSQVVQAERAIAQLQTIEAALTKMSQTAPNGWAGAAAYIDAQVAANPGDAAWEAMKARKDKIVADFQARKNMIAAINAAIASA